MQSLELSSPRARQTVSPYSNNHRIALERLFRRISNLSTLPTVAQRVLQVASDPQADADSLREVIQCDVALTANVLRRANASLYSPRNRIADLRSAIALIGFREVRNVCLTVFVARMFNEPASYRGYSREKLWHHCVATAITASKIARMSEKIASEEAYVCGLLHHVGTMLLDQHLRAQFRQVVDGIDPETPTYRIERDLLSFDQGQMGAYVLTRWNFPDQVADAVWYYPYPQLYQGEHRCMVHTVALANYICSRAGWTSLGVQNVAAPQQATFEILGVDPLLADLVWGGVRESVAEAIQL